MEKKEDNNINNKNSFPSKDIHNSDYCEHPNSFRLERISKFVHIFDSSDYHYSCDEEDVPHFIQVPIDPELQKVGIQEMTLFGKKLTLKTESRVVVLVKDKTGVYQLLIPTQKPYGKHADKLSETARQLFYSHVFQSSLEERMKWR